MAFHGVVILNETTSDYNGAYNRTAISGSDIDNGMVFRLDSLSTVDGEREVWSVSLPSASGSTLSGLWMAYSGDETAVVNGKYKGLTPDPREFVNMAGYPFPAIKLAKHDIITMTEDALSGSFVSGSATPFVNAADGSLKLTWGATQTANATSLKLLEVTYISLPTTGAPNSLQRVTAYRFVCVAD